MVKLEKRIKRTNGMTEIQSIGFDFGIIEKSINLKVNQKNYIKYSYKLCNEYGVKKISFDDLFRISLIKEFYDNAEKDKNGYMVYTGREYEKKYQLIKCMGKISASKYRLWGLLELGTQIDHNGKGVYKFTKLGEDFLKDVLNLK